MGLEPTTFSLQGNCAPNCATAPNQTAVIIEVPVNDLFVLHNSSLRLASERTRAKLSCATLPQAVVCLTRPTLTLFPLLIQRCFCRANRDGHPTGTRTRICTLKGCRPRPVRRWDDKAGFYLNLPVVTNQTRVTGMRRLSTLVRPRRTKGGPVLWGMTPQSNSSFQLQSQSSKLLYTIRDQRPNGESKLRSILLVCVLNRHNSTLTMLQLPKPPRFVILAYLKSLWLLCANS